MAHLLDTASKFALCLVSSWKDSW